MSFLLPVILKLIWLLAFAVLPGLCLLRWIDFQYRSRLDLVLAIFATGIPLAGFCVYVLLLANAYYAPAAWLIPLLSAAGILASYRKSGRLLPLAAAPAPAAPLNSLDQAAIFICGLMLAVSFLDAATSPLHSRDAVVTWDQWAIQWTQRSNLYHTAQGGYPQLLPMFSSLLYKTTGHIAVPPAEQYALHALHPFLGLLLLIACVRAAQVFQLPAWGVLLVVFGFNTLKDAIAAGGADLLVTWMVLSGPLLFAAWQREEWKARWHGSPVLIACLFGAAFSKATGWFAILPLLPSLFWAGIQRPSGIQRTGIRAFPKPAMAGVLALPVLLSAPFYLTQYAASREPIERFDIHEVNFRLRPFEIGHNFQNVIGASYANATGWGRFQAAGKRFLADYGLPPAFTDAAPILPALLFLALIVASLFAPPFRPLGITAAAILAVWYATASYDLRNLLPALPFLGLCLTAGAIQLAHGRRKRAKFTLTGILAVFSLPMAFGIVAQAAAVAQDALLQDHLTARLQAAEAGFPENIKPFFRDEYAAWNFVERPGFLRRAPHTIAASPMYRWISTGIYPACDWNPAIVLPGDLFVASPGSPLPGEYGRWTELRTFGGVEVYLDERQPIDVPLQNLDDEAEGTRSMVAYNLPDRDNQAGFSVVWQATVETDRPDPALQACTELYSPAIADPELSATSVDFNQLASRIVRYSGVLAVRPVTLSRNLKDGIRFGICRAGTAQPLRLRSFRYSIYNW